MNLIAQTEQNLGPRIIGPGDLGTQVSSQSPYMLARIVSRIIGLLTIIAGIYFIIMLITSGIAVMQSGGDKGKLEDARNRMLNAVIGIVIVVAAIFIFNILANILGLEDILDFQAMIDRLFI